MSKSWISNLNEVFLLWRTTYIIYSLTNNVHVHLWKKNGQRISRWKLASSCKYRNRWRNVLLWCVPYVIKFSPLKIRVPGQVCSIIFHDFFAKLGLIKTLVLQEQQTVTDKLYTEWCLHQRVKELQTKFKIRHLMGAPWYQNNAPAHLSALMTAG